MTNSLFSSLPSRVPPTSDGFDGDLDSYPELAFRELDKEVRGETVSTSYLTHSLQKHPATFIPQIPSYLISEYAPNDGGVVLDVFGGSGTTGVEAIRQGHEYVGIEVNPLSKLISDVSTHPFPTYVLKEAFRVFESVDLEYYPPIKFPGRTKKEFWFEKLAIEQLEILRSEILTFRDYISNIAIPTTVVEQTAYSVRELQEQIWDVFVLVFANVVFETSNADPGVSKAYKSPIMKDAISEGTHPPDVFDTFESEFTRVAECLGDLWGEIEGRVPKSTTHLGDARSIDIDVDADLAISSPPYINAINYYRGSKLRLFWIADMIDELDASALRKSIIGSNSGASLRGIDTDSLPFTLRSLWSCGEAAYESTDLQVLDEQLERIMNADVSDAPKKSYLVWKFFAEDMVQSMSTVYESLVDGGQFFFVIGENVVGGEFVETRRYLRDIGANLGCFKSSALDDTEQFTHLGTAFDEIANRELFQSRNHDGGVIECEWVLAFER